MTDDEINQAIAEACGWTTQAAWHTQCRVVRLLSGELVPNPLEDLNACHEMEMQMDQHQGKRYMLLLLEILGGIEHNTDFDLHRATARQRCEALLRTIGEWKEVAA